MDSDNSEDRGPVSRRDFLRRAGKETAETGVRLVPGARLARTVLTGDAATGRQSLWQRFAAWRRHRAEGQGDPAEGADGGA